MTDTTKPAFHAMSINTATEGFKTEHGKNSTMYACKAKGVI